MGCAYTSFKILTSNSCFFVLKYFSIADWTLSLSKQQQWAWLNLQAVSDWLNDSFRRPFFPWPACRPAMTARGTSLALILYKIHAEISDRHAGPFCRPANQHVALHLKYGLLCPYALKTENSRFFSLFKNGWIGCLTLIDKIWPINLTDNLPNHYLLRMVGAMQFSLTGDQNLT